MKSIEGQAGITSYYKTLYCLRKISYLQEICAGGKRSIEQDQILSSLITDCRELTRALSQDMYSCLSPIRSSPHLKYYGALAVKQTGIPEHIWSSTTDKIRDGSLFKSLSLIIGKIENNLRQTSSYLPDTKNSRKILKDLMLGFESLNTLKNHLQVLVLVQQYLEREPVETPAKKWGHLSLVQD